TSGSRLAAGRLAAADGRLAVGRRVAGGVRLEPEFVGLFLRQLAGQRRGGGGAGPAGADLGPGDLGLPVGRRGAHAVDQVTHPPLGLGGGQRRPDRVGRGGGRGDVVEGGEAG